LTHTVLIFIQSAIVLLPQFFFIPIFKLNWWEPDLDGQILTSRPDLPRVLQWQHCCSCFLNFFSTSSPVQQAQISFAKLALISSSETGKLNHLCSPILNQTEHEQSASGCPFSNKNIAPAMKAIFISIVHTISKLKP
jgi:hypothetical protein